jgi:hypothetical protein
MKTGIQVVCWGNGQHLIWTDISERGVLLEKFVMTLCSFVRGISDASSWINLRSSERWVRQAVAAATAFFGETLSRGGIFNLKDGGTRIYPSHGRRAWGILGSRQNCIRRKQQQCSKSGKRLEHHLVDPTFQTPDIKTLLQNSPWNIYMYIYDMCFESWGQSMSNSMVVGAFYIIFIQSNSSPVKVSLKNKCRRAPTGSRAFVFEQRWPTSR